MGRRVKEEGASEGRSVIGRIGIELQGDIIPRRKPADFPLVLAYVNREQTDLRKQCRYVGGSVMLLAGAASDGSVVGSRAVTYRSSSRPMRTTACFSGVRWPMLEPYASKGARTVLRGGGSGDRASLPDVRHEAVAVTVMLSPE